MNRLPSLLAFDTSTEQLALALLHGGQVLLDNSPGGAAASAALLPRAHALLAQAGLTMQSLDAVAFGVGPGAFTGLRTSCAVAQGLGFGIGCPLLAIDSLLIVAEDARVHFQTSMPAESEQVQGFDVLVAVDARMEQAYVAHYAYRPGLTDEEPTWQTLRLPTVMDLHSLHALAQPDANVQGIGWRAGSAWQAFGDRVYSQPGARQLDAETNRAAALGRLAGFAWQRGPRLDPADALPIYLRDKVALTTQERQAVKAAALR